MAQEPTHHVSHRSLGRANIRITQQNEDRLRSDNPQERHGAERHVAATASYALAPRGSSGQRFVRFDELLIARIEHEPEPWIPMGPNGDPLDVDSTNE